MRREWYAPDEHLSERSGGDGKRSLGVQHPRQYCQRAEDQEPDTSLEDQGQPEEERHEAQQHDREQRVQEPGDDRHDDLEREDRDDGDDEEDERLAQEPGGGAHAAEPTSSGLRAANRGRA